jgi:DNA-binding SARP family transcriptional activator
VVDEPWGAALLDLARAWCGDGSIEGPAASAESAGDAFRRLGTGVLEAWARSLGALSAVDAGFPDAGAQAVAAEALARASGTPAARMLAHAALSRVDAVHADDHVRVVAVAADETGLVLPPWAAGRDPALPASPSGAAAASRGGVPVQPAARGRATQARIRTLGGFALEVDGRPVSLDGVKPRARSLFRLLAVHAGAPVHREVLQESLWPESDAGAGARSLHVALSALRRLLDEEAGAGGSRLIARDGDAYRLAVAAEDVDLGRFEQAIAAGRATLARGEPSAAAFASAVDLYTGDLLPEEGPADWVTDRRDQCRARAIEAAERLAEVSLLADDLATAVRACRFGLELDRYQDALWRMLIAARDRGGDAGAATRDRREYALVLETLGVAADGAAAIS